MVLIGQFHLCNSLVFVFFLFCHTHIGLYQFSRRKTTLPIVFTHPRHCQNCTPAYLDLPSEKGQGMRKGELLPSQPGHRVPAQTQPVTPLALYLPFCHWLFTWLPGERSFRGREMCERRENVKI